MAWPAIDLRQVRRLTDDTGLIQHAVYATPDPHHGYCIDDNARALIAAVRLAELGQLGPLGDEALPIHTYLQFVFYAFNPDASGGTSEASAGSGQFRNFMGFDRGWLEDVGSEDSQARGLWALGEAVRHGPTPNVRDLAAEVYERALPGVARLNHARSWAFALLGVLCFLEARPDHGPSRDLLRNFAKRLSGELREQRAADWPWWESIVTYDNAKLPHALLLAGKALGDRAMCGDALESLTWLIDRQTETNTQAEASMAKHLSVIGNDGWMTRGGTIARFDQQPLEAYALVDACLDAARYVGDNGKARIAWERQARMCFAWFVGRNDLGITLIDPDTGGCRDGLHRAGVNRNQGAESTLAYVLAVLELHRYEQDYSGWFVGAAASG